MFLVADGDAEKIKAALAKFDPEHLDVDFARQTSKDIKGPYCRTSPLVPFVRKAHLSVPWKRGVVDDITEFLNAQGVTMTDFDEYRAGKDVDLQGFAHLPTGLAEFPQVRSIQTFFTHRPVSTFDRVFFQLTDELYIFVWNDPRAGERECAAREAGSDGGEGDGVRQGAGAGPARRGGGRGDGVRWDHEVR
jgi:hypothetical protein